MFSRVLGSQCRCEDDSDDNEDNDESLRTQEDGYVSVFQGKSTLLN